MEKEKMTAVDYFFNEIQRMQYFIGNDLYNAYKQAKEMEKEQIEEAQQLRKHAVSCWVSINDAKPNKDGNYLTYIQNSKYDSIGFTQFIDGEFMSSFVTHWAMVSKPCS